MDKRKLRFTVHLLYPKHFKVSLHLIFLQCRWRLWANDVQKGLLVHKSWSCDENPVSNLDSVLRFFSWHSTFPVTLIMVQTYVYNPLLLLKTKQNKTFSLQKFSKRENFAVSNAHSFAQIFERKIRTCIILGVMITYHGHNNGYVHKNVGVHYTRQNAVHESRRECNCVCAHGSASSTCHSWFTYLFFFLPFFSLKYLKTNPRHLTSECL